jgi:hypothetical protein
VLAQHLEGLALVFVEAGRIAVDDVVLEQLDVALPLRVARLAPVAAEHEARDRLQREALLQQRAEPLGLLFVAEVRIAHHGDGVLAQVLDELRGRAGGKGAGLAGQARRDQEGEADAGNQWSAFDDAASMGHIAPQVRAQRSGVMW